MKRSEEDFVNEGMTPDEIATLGEQGNVSYEPEGEPAPEPEPEVIEKPVVKAPTEPGPEQRMVDVRAVQEARAEARAAQQELAKYRAEQIRLDERVNMLNQALAPKPEVIAPPTEEEDPLGYFKHELSQTHKQLEEIRNYQKQVSEQQQVEQQRSAIIAQADFVLNQSRTTHHDVDEALNFATQAVRAEIAKRLTAQGVTGQQYHQMSERMFSDTLVRYAVECPQDPDEAAEHIRRHARYWGWTPQAAQVQQPEPVAPVVEQKTIQQRAEQQERHMSLSGVQGGAAPIRLDAKTIATMSDGDFKELMKTAAGRKQLEDVMGGV